MTHTHTLTRMHARKLGRTSLEEGSARHRDLYLKTHNIHWRQTAMPAAGFESAILAGDRPQTYALEKWEFAA